MDDLRDRELFLRVAAERRAEASRENGKKGGRPAKHLEELTCTCRSQDWYHPTTCPRGRALRRRILSS